MSVLHTLNGSANSAMTVIKLDLKHFTLVLKYYSTAQNTAIFLQFPKPPSTLCKMVLS